VQCLEVGQCRLEIVGDAFVIDSTRGSNRVFVRRDDPIRRRAAALATLSEDEARYLANGLKQDELKTRLVEVEASR